MPIPDDLECLRTEYVGCELHLAVIDIYFPFNPAHLFTLQSRQRNTLALLRRHGYYPQEDLRLLILNWSSGSVLQEYLDYGIKASQLHGTDLIYSRVGQARERLQYLPLTCADGQHLPYKSGFLDLVLQYTVFSSNLDNICNRTWLMRC